MRSREIPKIDHLYVDFVNNDMKVAIECGVLTYRQRNFRLGCRPLPAAQPNYAYKGKVKNSEKLTYS